MKFYDEVLKRIKEEIEKDPEKLGYNGKTDEEIVTILNGDYHKEYIATATFPPRLGQILRGIEGTPNIMETQDITNAKVMVIN